MNLSSPIHPDSVPSFASLPISRLQGVGPSLRERLAKRNLHGLFDLLLHLPLRYQDRTRILPLADLRPGMEAQVVGEIYEARIARGARPSLQVWLGDGTGMLLLRLFHFGRNQLALLRPGRRLRCFGEVRLGPRSLEMIHPEYRLLKTGQTPPVESSLSPVYPSISGISQTAWRNLVAQALRLLDAYPLEEALPPSVVAEFQLPSLAAALRFVHHPPPDSPLELLSERRTPAHRRLILEELVAHQLSLQRMRQRRRTAPAPALRHDGKLAAKLLGHLPFPLTAAQKRVVAEIAEDLAQPVPMLRLLQGDVGSGKTVVAALAALQAVDAGYQVAILAPTELLSEQHYRTLQQWLQPLGVRCLWLTGRHRGRDRRAKLAAIASGEIPLIIGTHALFQREVAFANLGLVIVDEQHRFGVHQRLQLREKGRKSGQVPHQLIMTATPIPRSLAMTSYGDLDLSILDELPPGRKPVKTVAVPDARREEVIQRVRNACLQGRQAYWVCTLVEESEVLQAQAAEECAQNLRESLPDLRIGLVHGRMPPAERAPLMAAFGSGELDLLVATTVIEVGLDVPNASLMIVENPERLGLAQLHQLRGRIGRGTQEGHCVLLYRSPLSELSRMRIELLRQTTDGFLLAEKDLQLRGPGEVLGTRQAGAVQFRIADPVAQAPLLPQARKIAEILLHQREDAVSPLIRRWFRDREHLAGV